MFVIDPGWYFAHYADNGHFPKYWRWPFAVDANHLHIHPARCNCYHCFMVYSVMFHFALVTIVIDRIIIWGKLKYSIGHRSAEVRQ